MTIREVATKELKGNDWNELRLIIVVFNNVGEDDETDFHAKNIDELEEQWKRYCSFYDYDEGSVKHVKDEGKVLMLF